MVSNQICHIHWHLLDDRVIERLDVLKRSSVFSGNKVDGRSFTSETTSSTNPSKKFVSKVTQLTLKYKLPVNVVLSVCRQIIVDDERDLLHINSSGQQVSSDEDSRWSWPELLHNDIPLLLFHISMLFKIKQLLCKLRHWDRLYQINRLPHPRLRDFIYFRWRPSRLIKQVWRAF